MVDDPGLDEIMERHRQAGAGGAECAPHLICSSPATSLPIKKHPRRGAFLLVRATGLEPARSRNGT